MQLCVYHNLSLSLQKYWISWWLVWRTKSLDVFLTQRIPAAPLYPVHCLKCCWFQPHLHQPVLSRCLAHQLQLQSENKTLTQKVKHLEVGRTDGFRRISMDLGLPQGRAIRSLGGARRNSGSENHMEKPWTIWVSKFSKLSLDPLRSS